MDNLEYLGTGLKFPIEVNPATGRVNASSGSDSVRESIYLILMTNRKELLARPDFGSNLDYYTFMDVNYTNVNMMIRELTETILTQEPRIDNIEITPEPDLDNGRLIMKIDYWLAGQHNPDSLVFPFYLDVTEETVEDTDTFDEIEEDE